MRLNLGAASKRIEGYSNVDIRDIEGVDVVHDLTKYPWPFTSNSIEKIMAQEFLEHIAFRECMPLLREAYRILQPGGVIHIQVPDIGAMCEMYVRGEICACVPRKAANYEDYKANPGCFNCGGKGKIHPERWAFAFSGAQKHPWDIHLNHFYPGKLKACLEAAGFEQVEQKPNIYKLIMEAKK